MDNIVEVQQFYYGEGSYGTDGYFSKAENKITINLNLVTSTLKVKRSFTTFKKIPLKFWYIFDSYKIVIKSKTEVEFFINIMANGNCLYTLNPLITEGNEEP